MPSRLPSRRLASLLGVCRLLPLLRPCVCSRHLSIQLHTHTHTQTLTHTLTHSHTQSHPAHPGYPPTSLPPPSPPLPTPPASYLAWLFFGHANSLAVPTAVKVLPVSQFRRRHRSDGRLAQSVSCGVGFEPSRNYRLSVVAAGALPASHCPIRFASVPPGQLIRDPPAAIRSVSWTSSPNSTAGGVSVKLVPCRGGNVPGYCCSGSAGIVVVRRLQVSGSGTEQRVLF